jgi:hypothetical protein
MSHVSTTTGDLIYIDFRTGADLLSSVDTLLDGEVMIANGAGGRDLKGSGLNVNASGRLTIPEALQYDATPGALSQVEGLTFWDSSNKCLAYYTDDPDVIMQVGQETWVRVYNNSGATILNGKACYLTTFFSGFPTIQLANASAAATCLSTIGMATHDIEDGTYGFIVISGTLRDINTTGCTSGNILWLSATTSGEFTETRPGSPNYAISLGNCGEVHASTGSVLVRVTVGNNTGDVINIFNGSILEDHTALVASNGTTITLTLEKTGGGDLRLFFDGTFASFTATPSAASVNLTAGTDTSPVLNYVFIPKDTNTLTANTTGFDTTQQIVPVGTVFCQSAASAQTDKVHKFHAWTDHVADSDGQGHISHVNRWIRAQNATWLSGSALTPTGGANTYDVATTLGRMLQLHEHVVDAFDTSTGSSIFIINDSTTAYKKVGNLTQEVTDSAAGDMTGKYYKHVFWIASSEGTGVDKLYCNLPSGSYNSASSAISDLSRYANYSIPAEFTGTGILIAEVVVQNAGGAGGTFTIHDTTSLRGLVPSTSAGGGGAGGGAEAWDDLTDTPASKSGQALKYVRINAGETAFEYVTAPSGSSPLTTKGDVYTYDTSDARLPVGTNGQFLSADSAEAAGLKWIDDPFPDPMAARGDIIFRNSSNVTARLVKGSAGQLLTSDGTDISWADPSFYLNWAVYASSPTLTSRQGAMLDGTAAARTATLPATPSEGDIVGVKALDITNTVTIARNGSKIEGVEEDLVINAAGSGFTLVYTNSTYGWVVVTQIGANTSLVTLTDAATIAFDASLGDDFKVTLAGNRTMGNPTNVTAGQTGHISVYQDATGSRTLAWSSNWNLPGGTAPTLTTTASAEDVFAFWAETTSEIHVVLASKDSK